MADAPARPRRRIVAILNQAAGTAPDPAGLAHLRARFARDGDELELRVAQSGAELAARTATAVASAPDIIVAGGGDGTVSCVAGALVGTDIALGVLPIGTLNHFAKDLRIPLELDAAIETVLTGEVHTVDVGEVNGRRFVNNSSLGLYPKIVNDRVRQQRRLGIGKWPAFARACIAAFKRFPFLGVRLEVDGRHRRFRTPLVFIGNNAYRMDGFNIGGRDLLDAGCLSLYVVQRAGRLRLLQLALRALFGRLRQARDFEATIAQEIVVESKRHRLHVSADGEVVTLKPPLHYRVLPRALRVIRPARAATA
jgi:YegS/Rv2252/BmrU family lipid kinase